MARTKENYIPAKTVDELHPDKIYRTSDLKQILKHLNLNYSIYSILDAETYKCDDYTCAYRNTEKVKACKRCGGSVTPPSIPSPRLGSGGKGHGHRRYTKKDIEYIIQVFSKRKPLIPFEG